jgi:Ca2+-binding RTX toxin-like protein
MAMKKRALVLGALLLVLAAAPALAATVTGDGTLVGTTGNDTIAAGNGNDQIWGLGGYDTISAGNGNDVIDANGKCPPGVKSGDYPNGLPSSEYCEHHWVPGSKDTIAAGGGDDTIFGGGGPNTISVGGGDDTIYGGPIGDTISAGNGDDHIWLGFGPSYTGSKVSTGSGDDVIHAQNGVKDTISCAKGNGTTVYADRSDVISGCAHVIYAPDPSPDPYAGSSTDRTSRGKAKHSHVKKAAKKAAKKAKKHAARTR